MEEGLSMGTVLIDNLLNVDINVEKLYNTYIIPGVGITMNACCISMEVEYGNQIWFQRAFSFY